MCLFSFFLWDPLLQCGLCTGYIWWLQKVRTWQRIVSFSVSLCLSVGWMKKSGDLQQGDTYANLLTLLSSSGCQSGSAVLCKLEVFSLCAWPGFLPSLLLLLPSHLCSSFPHPHAASLQAPGPASSLRLCFLSHMEMFSGYLLRLTGWGYGQNWRRTLFWQTCDSITHTNAVTQQGRQALSEVSIWPSLPLAEALGTEPSYSLSFLVPLWKPYGMSSAGPPCLHQTHHVLLSSSFILPTGKVSSMCVNEWVVLTVFDPRKKAQAKSWVEHSGSDLLPSPQSFSWVCLFVFY